jgi:hypothetical protein
MTKKADLNQTLAELHDAQTEIERVEKVESSLGDVLSMGFRALLRAVSTLTSCFDDHDRKLAEHDLHLKIALAQIGDLQRQVHGLKISRGKAVASNQRALRKAQTAVEHAKTVLDGMSVH